MSLHGNSTKQHDPTRIQTQKTRKLVVQSSPIFHYYVEGWPFRACKCVGKLNFPIFCNDKKTLFTRFENFFWLHPQTANLGTLRRVRPGSFVAPVKTYTMVKKVEKNTVVSEKIGVKDFSLGQFIIIIHVYFRQEVHRKKINMGKAVEKNGCVVYGSKSRPTTCPWLDNVNFRKTCALLMTSLISGEVRGTKNMTVVLFFSLNIVKISSTGNNV